MPTPIINYFPVAGLGTRFLPATKPIPKEIMTLIDGPLIQYAIDEAREAGIEEFILVTSCAKSALEDYFNETPYQRAELERKGKAQFLGILDETKWSLARLLMCGRHRHVALAMPSDVTGT